MKWLYRVIYVNGGKTKDRVFHEIELAREFHKKQVRNKNESALCRFRPMRWHDKVLGARLDWSRVDLSSLVVWVVLLACAGYTVFMIGVSR